MATRSQEDVSLLPYPRTCRLLPQLVRNWRTLVRGGHSGGKTWGCLRLRKSHIFSRIQDIITRFPHVLAAVYLLGHGLLFPFPFLPFVTNREWTDGIWQCKPVQLTGNKPPHPKAMTPVISYWWCLCDA